MEQLGFCFLIEKCIGCNACQVACKDYNHLEPGIFFRRASTIEMIVDGVNQVIHYSAACNHCQEAACVKACPVKAMKYEADGTVGHNQEQCIGCGTCRWACPYGAITFRTETGKVDKCHSCQQLRMEGKMPACVEACMTGCLKFGNLKVLQEKAGEKDKIIVTDERPFLPAANITKPSLIIVSKQRSSRYE